MLISFSEQSPLIRALGTASKRPEIFGVDVLAKAGDLFLGYQRKTINDLIASLHDGRLTVERAQWNKLLESGGIVTLIIEGRMSWTLDGVLLGVSGKPFTRRQFRRLVHSVSRQGVSVQHTDSVRDTVNLIEDLIAYHEQPRTGSWRSGRPSPKGQWGKATSRDWAVHLMTSFPDVGPTTAEAIIDHFAGVPLAWRCTKTALLEVPGVGKKRADSLWKALQPILEVIEGEKKA